MKTFFFFLALCVSAFAEEPAAQLRTSFANEGEPWVGKKLTFVVEIFAPGIFNSTPAFDLPQVSGLLIIPPEGHPVVRSEQINGTDYIVQRHELAVLARRGGPFAIPPFSVRFAFKPSSTSPESRDEKLLTPALRFTAVVPPGAGNMRSLITARDLEVKETWDRQPDAKTKPGDAFVRTVDFTAPDVPAMLFPEFPAEKIRGLGVYPSTPLVLDHMERSDTEGHRQDRITYVCEQAGHFTIPAVTFTWWDLDSKELKTILLPARNFDVIGPPAPPVPKPFPIKRVATGGLLILVLSGILAMAWRYRRASRRWISPLFPRHLQPLNPAE